MLDFFSILKSYNRQQASTYADLIGSTTREEQIKRQLTEQELQDYMIIKESNQQRLFNISGNNRPTDSKLDKTKQMMISGIGQVTQMM